MGRPGVAMEENLGVVAGRMPGIEGTVGPGIAGLVGNRRHSGNRKDGNWGDRNRRHDGNWGAYG